MPKAKIDRVKLNQLLNAGKSQKEVAQVFGVTEGAVSKAKKELNINVVKSVALENAHRVVDKNLNAVDQLQKINNHANWLLNHVMKWVKGDNAAIQVLEKNVRKVNVGTREKPEIIDEFKFKDPHEIVTLDQISSGKMTRNGLGLRGKKDGAPSRSLARA